MRRGFAMSEQEDQALKAVHHVVHDYVNLRLLLSRLPDKFKAQFDKEIAKKLRPESDFRDLDLR